MLGRKFGKWTVLSCRSERSKGGKIMFECICECCGEAPSGRYKNLCLDHCHTTGKFRAWLCDKCNRALGMVIDNPDILRKLAMILENFGTEECI